MNQSPLPEDFSQWPENPHELLGVKLGCTLKDLKRNYSRLIRYYKPEHHPEAFRRIRIAYEQVQGYLEYFASYEPVSKSEHEATVDPESCSFQNEDLTTIDQPVEKATDFSIRLPTVDSLWEQAIKGEEEQAYYGLIELHERAPGRSSIVLRLYWLLTLNRKLDSTRVPADWLVGILIENQLLGPASELYRREIEWFPEEAFSAIRQNPSNRCQPKTADGVPRVGAGNRPPKCSAGSHRRRPEIMAAQFQFLDEEGWVELLLQVVHSSVWYDQPAVAGVVAISSKRF